MTLCDPRDCSSSIHGIILERILEWVAMSSSRGSFHPRDQTCVCYVSYTGRQILHHCAAWEAQVCPYLVIKKISSIIQE